MSLVGPRPNLLNQEELINERDSRGVYCVRPGITGLAQINKISSQNQKGNQKNYSLLIQSHQKLELNKSDAK